MNKLVIKFHSALIVFVAIIQCGILQVLRENFTHIELKFQTLAAENLQLIEHMPRRR